MQNPSDRNRTNRYDDVVVRRGGAPRTVYILAVSGVLGVVTFALVYLSTLSFLGG